MTRYRDGERNEYTISSIKNLLMIAEAEQLLEETTREVDVVEALRIMIDGLRQAERDAIASYCRSRAEASRRPDTEADCSPAAMASAASRQVSSAASSYHLLTSEEAERRAADKEAREDAWFEQRNVPR